MNKWMSIVALFSSFSFFFVLLGAIVGFNYTLAITTLIDLIVIPFYFFIFITLVYTVYKWFKDKSKPNLKYMLFSITSVIITGSMILYIVWQYGITMSNFD